MTGAPADSLRELYRKLTGDDLSDAGEAQLLRFMELAGVRSNDALVMILFGLESYRNLYADIPHQVSEAAKLVVRQEAEALTQHAARVKQAMQEAMTGHAEKLAAGTIAKVADELASDTTRSIIEKQARDGLKGPMQDATGKLERLAQAARTATDRYDRKEAGIGGWLRVAIAGLFGGLVAASLPKMVELVQAAL